MRRELFPSYLYPTESWKKYDTPVLRTGVIIGFMQSGKTVLARHLAARAYKAVVRSGYDDSQFVYLETHSLKRARKWVEEYLPSSTRFLFIFVDDAVKYAHSRQKNVEETSYFVDVRHWTIKQGLITILYATQNFKLLDSIMRYGQVYMWKTVPLEFYLEKEAKQWTLRYIGLQEMVQVLLRLTSDVYDNDPQRSIEALRQAVVRIPLKNYGPKLYQGITMEAPPRSVWHKSWESEEDEDEADEYNYIDIGEARALARAVLRLIKMNNISFKMNRGKYLLVKQGETGEWRSLGPIIPLLERTGVELRTS